MVLSAECATSLKKLRIECGNSAAILPTQARNATTSLDGTMQIVTREQEDVNTGWLRLQVIRRPLQNSTEISQIQGSSSLVFCFSPLSFISTFFGFCFHHVVFCPPPQYFCFVSFLSELLFIIPTGFFDSTCGAIFIFLVCFMCFQPSL